MIPDIEHRILYKDERFYAAFPSITTLADGNLLLAFRRARDTRWLIADPATRAAVMADDLRQVDHVDSRSHIALLQLDPELRPLGPVTSLPCDPEAADQDASLLTLDDGSLLLASFSWYPFPARLLASVEGHIGHCHGSMEDTGCIYLAWGSHVSFSADRGNSWDHHRYLPPLPNSHDLLPGKRPLHGGAVRGSLAHRDGELFMASYSGTIGHPSSEAHLWSSKDGGRSWDYVTLIATDPQGSIGFQEPALCFDGAGRLLAVMRTSGADDRLATAVSTDKGLTWQHWRLHEARGHPWHPLPLRDGRVLLTGGYRHAPYGIRCHVLEGDLVRPGDPLVIRDDGASPDLGYPWTTRLADGRFATVYYFTADDGVRHIAASLFEIQ